MNILESIKKRFISTINSIERYTSMACNLTKGLFVEQMYERIYVGKDENGNYMLCGYAPGSNTRRFIREIDVIDIDKEDGGKHIEISKPRVNRDFPRTVTGKRF